MIFRRAEIRDAEELAEIRKKQLMDEGQKPDVNMDKELLGYFREKMESGELVQWIAEEDGKTAATGAIIFMVYPPSFTNPSGRKGYIANMYTADEYRGRGLAGRIIELLEEEARERGITSLILFASAVGRKAYLKSGFHDDDFLMEKFI